MVFDGLCIIYHELSLIRSQVVNAENLDSLDLLDVEEGPEWTEKQSKEKQFQKDKQEKQLIEAFEYGTLLPEYVDGKEEATEARRALNKSQDKFLE